MRTATLISPIFALLVGVACLGDPGEILQVDNRTSSAVTLCSLGTQVYTIKPNETLEFVILHTKENREFHYEIRKPSTRGACAGEVLAETTFTMREIEDKGGITIAVE